jgi:5'-nucleotidase
MAVSIQGISNHHFNTAATFVADLVPDFQSMAIPRGSFLNINVPNLPRNQIRGVRVSRQSIDLFSERYERRSDPRKRPYYWPGYEGQPQYTHQDADGALLSSDYISVTPVQSDMTDYTTMDRLKAWDFKNNGNRITS